ncbi:MFS transporter [Mycobacterium sp. KBS0706]|uniref:MFS transporter n=1 Tax=Mycobacterium sp. KBS0706 TaxID=2578109 RepID=UPI00110FDEA3|nr:MFS transporter [Mycobacterium sp. KBS0706]TSD88204.1 MFS transporter [Mycobacterium sp. KBS0706]
MTSFAEGTTATADLRGARLATRAMFLICGTVTASWAPQVPLAKARLGIDDGVLGLALLGMGAGAMVAMPLAGFLAARFSSRVITALGGLVICLSLPLIILAPDALMLGLALFLFGAATGSMDVAMNVQAAAVEARGGRPLMSSFHGMFSVGGLIGAGGASLMLGLGLSPLTVALVVSGLMLALLVAQAGSMLPPEPRPTQTGMRFTLPRGLVLVLGLLTFVLFQAEGAVLDWSAVFLHEARGQDPAVAGLGYAMFAVAMAVMRLAGDGITSRFGGEAVVRLGSALAAAGFLLAILVPWPAAALIGFALVGIGAANVVPVLFSAAGRVPGMAPGLAISTIATLGYCGILAGPAAIGFIADHLGLPAALGIVAALLVATAASARAVRV